MESSKGNIGFDSLNAIDLFVDSNNFWNTNELIFHIPHSSTIIPYFTGYVDICKISDETLEIRDLIKKALNLRVYSKRKGIIYEGDRTIAVSEEDLVKELLDPNKQQEKLALMTKVDGKNKLKQSIS